MQTTRFAKHILGNDTLLDIDLCVRFKVLVRREVRDGQWSGHPPGLGLSSIIIAGSRVCRPDAEGNRRIIGSLFRHYSVQMGNVVLKRK